MTNGDAADVRRLDAAGLPDTADAIRRADVRRLAVTRDETEIRAGGFVWAGTNESGETFYVRDAKPTRDWPRAGFIVAGDETAGGGNWGADLFPSRESFYAADERGRVSFPYTYATAAALVSALRAAGLIG